MSRTGRSIGDRRRTSILRPACLLLLPILVLAGCRGRSDLVEAELRTRDTELRQTRTDLERAQGLNYALQHELQCRPAMTTTATPFCETQSGPITAMAGMVKEVALARGTGGLDEDQRPGDEALLVILVPKDMDGSAVKVPGNLVVEAAEVTAEGVKIPLSSWEVASLDLQKMWRAGLLSSGYHIKLAWKRQPMSEKLRVTCRFTTLPDNRLFEADRDVSIHLPPGSVRPVGPVIVPGPMGGAASFPAPAVEQGPVLTPGAWLGSDRPEAVSSAKPAPVNSPARLLEPVPGRDE